MAGVYPPGRSVVCLCGMTADHLEGVLKTAGAKLDKDGWASLPEASTLTLHVAHDGASMTVSRIDGIKQEGELIYARNPKRELFAVVRSDVFAIAIEGDSTIGKAVRRAGFG
jgi:hypothetical protein